MGLSSFLSLSYFQWIILHHRYNGYFLGCKYCTFHKHIVFYHELAKRKKKSGVYSGTLVLVNYTKKINTYIKKSLHLLTHMDLASIFFCFVKKVSQTLWADLQLWNSITVIFLLYFSYMYYPKIQTWFIHMIYFLHSFIYWFLLWVAIPIFQSRCKVLDNDFG